MTKTGCSDRFSPVEKRVHLLHKVISMGYCDLMKRYALTWSRLLWLIVFVSLLCSNACIVKKTVKATMPQTVRFARDATLDQLIDIVNRQSQVVRSLQSTALTINAERRSSDASKIEKYRSAPGYIFLERPGKIRLKVLVPVAKNTLIDMAADGDGFKIWYPRERKFYVGPSDSDEIEYSNDKKGLSTFRPQHLIDSILIEEIPIDDPEQGHFLYEENEPTAKYYILSVVKQQERQRLHLLRRLWIERYGFHIVRQQYYSPSGILLSDVKYENYKLLDGIEFPTTIHIDRPYNNYTIALDFKTVKFNVTFDADTFTLVRPEGSELVEIKGKKS